MMTSTPCRVDSPDVLPPAGVWAAHLRPTSGHRVVPTRLSDALECCVLTAGLRARPSSALPGTPPFSACYLMLSSASTLAAHLIVWRAPPGYRPDLNRYPIAAAKKTLLDLERCRPRLGCSRIQGYVYVTCANTLNAAIAQNSDQLLLVHLRACLGSSRRLVAYAMWLPLYIFPATPDSCWHRSTGVVLAYTGVRPAGSTLLSVSARPDRFCPAYLRSRQMLLYLSANCYVPKTHIPH
ncbi:hypothetical protein NUW54_g4723 [Trametes sanguinea]|uniref:Uncharacterized protein n=1 Tax=Trametes sanguinea TaxID=158606 RepID=A0ACC1PZP1_9APHY|nr:hypothetical protein NUW54_g4723 [Trametes sanguinea]